MTIKSKLSSSEIYNQTQSYFIFSKQLWDYLLFFAFISTFPASCSELKMTLPLYPEVSIIPKDGGTRSDGYSDAATKSTTVRL